MKTIAVKKLDLDLKDYTKRAARDGDYDTFITESCIVTDDDTGEYWWCIRSSTWTMEIFCGLLIGSAMT